MEPKLHIPDYILFATQKSLVGVKESFFGYYYYI